jgi:hypothetical protein
VAEQDEPQPDDVGGDEPDDVGEQPKPSVLDKILEIRANRREPTPEQRAAAEAEYAKHIAEQKAARKKRAGSERILNSIRPIEIEKLLPERKVEKIDRAPLPVYLVAEPQRDSVPNVGGRPLEELKIDDVEKAETRLKARLKIKRGRMPKPLTYEAIAIHAGLVGPTGRPNRERVEQFEELIRLGWDLRQTQPGFSAREGYVRLPTPRTAAQIRRLRRSR